VWVWEVSFCVSLLKHAQIWKETSHCDMWGFHSGEDSSQILSSSWHHVMLWENSVRRTLLPWSSGWSEDGGSKVLWYVGIIAQPKDLGFKPHKFYFLNYLILQITCLHCYSIIGHRMFYFTGLIRNVLSRWFTTLFHSFYEYQKQVWKYLMHLEQISLTLKPPQIILSLVIPAPLTIYGDFLQVNKLYIKLYGLECRFSWFTVILLWNNLKQMSGFFHKVFHIQISRL